MRQGAGSTPLDDGEPDELDAAVARARQSGKRLAELAATDFPLPGLAPRIAQWRRTLGSGRGCRWCAAFLSSAIRPKTASACSLAWGCSWACRARRTALKSSWGTCAARGLSYNDPGVRGYRTSAALAYHCDFADVVGLFCLRTAKSGGTSRFVSSVTVWNEFRRRPDLAQRMFEPLLFDTRAMAV